MRFHHLLVSLLASFIFLGSSSDVQAAKIVRISPFAHKGEAIYEAWVDSYKKILEESGLFKVILLPAMSLGGAEAEFQAVINGSCQVAMNSTGNMGTLNPLWAALDLPFLVKDREDVAKIFGGNSYGYPQSDVARKMEAPIVEKGAHVLSVDLTTMRVLAMVKPFGNVSETYGRKLRVTTSPAHIAAINDQGWKAVPLPASELVTSLQQGVIDGHDPSTDAWWNMFADIEKNLILANHLPCLYVAYTSQKFWNSLNDEEKAVFQKASETFSNIQGKYQEARMAKMMPQRASEGCVYYTPTPEELTVMKKHTEKTMEVFSPEVQQIIREIQTLLAK